MESAREAIGRLCSDDGRFELLERKQSDNEYSNDTTRKRHRRREAKQELASAKKQKENERDASNLFDGEPPIVGLQRPVNQGGENRSLSSTPGLNNFRAFSSERSACGNGRSARAVNVPPEFLIANPQRRAGGNPESDDDYDEEDLRERLLRRGRSGLGGSAPQVQVVEIPSSLAAAAQENPLTPLHATNTFRQGLTPRQPVVPGKKYTGIWARGFELDPNPPPKLVTSNPVVENPDAPVTTRSGRILGLNLASTPAPAPTPVPSPVSAPVSQPPLVPTSKDTGKDKFKGKSTTRQKCRCKRGKLKCTCNPVDEESEDDEVCDVCQLLHSEPPNEIFFCEKRDRGFHREYCEPKVFKIPKGDWLCKDCDPNGLPTEMKVKLVGSKLLEDDHDKSADQGEGERKISWKCKCKKGKDKCTCKPLEHTKKSEDEEVCTVCQLADSEPPNEILFCDSCGRGFHQEWCEQKVLEISEHDWLCKDCGPNRLLEDDQNKGTDQDGGRKRNIWKCKCKKGKLKCTCKPITSPRKSEDHEDTDTDQDDGDVPNRPNVNKASTTSTRTTKASKSSTKNNKHTDKMENHSGATQRKSGASASKMQVRP